MAACRRARAPVAARPARAGVDRRTEALPGGSGPACWRGAGRRGRAQFLRRWSGPTRSRLAEDPDGVHIACNPASKLPGWGARGAAGGRTDHDFFSWPRPMASGRRSGGHPCRCAVRSEMEAVFAADGHREQLEVIRTFRWSTTNARLIGVLAVAQDHRRGPAGCPARPRGSFRASSARRGSMPWWWMRERAIRGVQRGGPPQPGLQPRQVVRLSIRGSTA